jgi:hypothetical protein
MIYYTFVHQFCGTNWVSLLSLPAVGSSFWVELQLRLCSFEQIVLEAFLAPVHKKLIVVDPTFQGRHIVMLAERKGPKFGILTF